MAEQIQCCGTCKWWDQQDDEYPDVGECSAPAPKCFEEISRCQMIDDEGTDCPCWAAKENPND